MTSPGKTATSSGSPKKRGQRSAGVAVLEKAKDSAAAKCAIILVFVVMSGEGVFFFVCCH